MQYEMVIGLEVHVELATESKIFCGCKTLFGQEVNAQVCPVCLGLPGTLPVLNEKVVEYAVKAGLATECDITPIGKQDRKNYFYPDLTKAYQISQYDQPIATDGQIIIEDGVSKRIGITRIHIEEDAGKLVHHKEKGTLIDYNRAGVPLIEIVSEPDIRSAQEAKLYLQKLQRIILETGISDCKMNEGSFRCDVNLSIRPVGTEPFGTRTEMKNLNSFNAISKAIENEYQRQIKVIQSGGTITQESRKWDQDKQKSVAMRSKEDAHDYRYFPDPDLMPIHLSDTYVDDIRSALPELPDQRKVRLVEKYNLQAKDAEILAMTKAMAVYFETVYKDLQDTSLFTNLLIGSWSTIDSGKISESSFVELCKTLDEGEINHSLAKKILQLEAKESIGIEAIMDKYDLRLITDDAVLQSIIKEVLTTSERIVEDYKAGKVKALQALVGKVMKKTQGKAEPNKTQILLVDLLDKDSTS